MLRRILPRIIETWTLYSVPLSLMPIPEEKPGYCISRMGKMPESSTLDLLLSHRGMKYLRSIEERIQKRDEFAGFSIVHLETKQIVAISWIRFKSHYEKKIGDSLELNEDEVFFYDAFCVPEHRGNQFHYLMMIKRIDFSFTLGFRKGYTLVNRSNKASMRTLNRLQFEKRFSKTTLLPRLLRSLRKK